MRVLLAVFVFAVVALFALPGCASDSSLSDGQAEPDPLGPAEEVELEVRLYDIRGMLRATPRYFYINNRLGLHDEANFDLNNALSSTNSGGTLIDRRSRLMYYLFNTPRRLMIAYVIERVVQTVAQPEDWGFKGNGSPYLVNELHGNLVVRTTRENHVVVYAVLDEMMDKHGDWHIPDYPGQPDPNLFDIGPRPDADTDANDEADR